MDGYTLNAARTIREYESSIQRPKAERTINDSILSALLRGDELPEMDVKAIRQYGIQCSEYLDFGYDVDASLSGMLSPHAVLEPRPSTPYVFRRAGFDNLPFIYTQRHLRNAIAPKEADNHQHGLTIEQIKSLPEKLEEPVVVFDQPNYTVNGRSFEGKGVAAVLDMYDPDGVPVIAYFFPNGYGTKTNDNGCSNVIASLYGRDNFTSYLARAANEEKILYIDSEKYEQMEKELPRYGGTRFPPALAALSMDIIIPSSYICKMKAEINPKLSDCEREHNSLNRTMLIADGCGILAIPKEQINNFETLLLDFYETNKPDKFFSFLTKEAIYGLDRTVPSSQNLKVKCKAATLRSNALKTRSNTVGISKTQNADRTAHTEHIE